MSTIDFTCQKCEGNFELELQDLVDGTEAVECPHCNNKLGKVANEDFIAALGELQAQLTAIAKKFSATIEIDTEDLAADDLEDEDDDEDDEDEDDDEDDDDEDDDLDDDDEDFEDDDDR
jgi:DNA-directed RNA polymerase subunit RPC12/RpoP